MRELIGRWRTAVRGAGATAPDGDLDTAGAELIGRWSEAHRHYHTVGHLVAVLDQVDAGATGAAHPAAVRLAAWWHDAVYDPTAGGDANERASAALAERSLRGLGVPPPIIEHVVRLILLTAGHQVPDGDSDGALLCDADLAILAGPADAYDAYAAAIRREYAHLPDEVYRAGRAAVLRQLTGLPRLYRLAHLPAHERHGWAERARANLRRELTRLA